MASNLPIAETVGMALNTLKANRLRSLLTMLGIVIGNASVITLVGEKQYCCDLRGDTGIPAGQKF